MYEATDRRIRALASAGEGNLFADGLKGIEKEALRVTPDGEIAATAHPRALGSPLTNRYITTDYSEALIELVTPPAARTWETLQCLCDLHQFVYENLDEEMLWATSMPCAVRGDDSVPIAEYGSSNVGRMKNVYRRGLGVRYGRVMQAISGVHFNYSFGPKLWPALASLDDEMQDEREFVSAAYFALLRNFRRFGWLVLYLFGASPAVCKSFAPARDAGLESFDNATWYGPWATTLRMSDIGYKNRVQAQLEISVNDIDSYVDGLWTAISTPHPDYERIGVKVDGEWRQLNANVLQIENEYYSLIRPKRVAFSGEKPTAALERGGVEYVEVRALDVSAFDPVGVNQSQLNFLETLLAFCVLHDSPPIDNDEQREIDRNQLVAAREGRRPELALSRNGRSIGLVDWGFELVDRLAQVAELMDRGTGARVYRSSVETQAAMLKDPSLTPSARILDEMTTAGETFFEFGMRMSRVHRDYFASLAEVSEGRRAALAAEADRSAREQAAIEAADAIDFDEYLARYFAGTLEPRPRGGTKHLT